MKVYLIGAGPGDPGLLTIKGKDAIAAADVIVYDYLANDSLLSYARSDAELIYVGKQAGAHTMPQAEINKLLVAKAKGGKTVARLKGGDPYIFGRGGEEAEELIAAGIPFEEIPGISSTIAGPAYAGIPLTHRSFASSVTFITGHEYPGKPGSAHNWQALAGSGSTLVFVMGMKNLPHITASLITAGLAKDTPAALILWGTTAQQRSLVSTLEELPAAAVANGFINPSVIVVGKVVTLHDRLNWFEQRPLFGRSVLVTRSRHQASNLVQQLSDLGADVLQFPTIAIRPLLDHTPITAALADLPAFTWVLFTSANGVAIFWQHLTAAGKDSRAFAAVKVAAIGPGTAAALRQRGIEPDFIPQNYIAENMAQGLVARGMARHKILLARAAKARDVLPDALRQAGADLTILPLYETVPAMIGRDAVVYRLTHNSLDYITFASSSTVDNFFSAIPADLVRQSDVRLACIGPITAKTLHNYGLEAHLVPETFTLSALVNALARDAGE